MDLVNACCYGSSCHLNLCQLKSFTVISCCLACWRRACICNVLSLLLQPDPLLDLRSVWLHETGTLFYVPSSHLQIGTGTIRLCLSRIGLVGQLSLVLPVRCHCTSCQCGSSRRLTLLEYLRWLWILPQDSFGFPHLLKWAMCSTMWNLPYLGNLQLWQPISLCWCLILQGIGWVGLSTPRMHIAGPQPASQTLGGGGLKYKLSCHHCAANRLKQGSWNEPNSLCNAELVTRVLKWLGSWNEGYQVHFVQLLC